METVKIRLYNDFKSEITFADGTGAPIDVETFTFRFIYADTAGNQYEISYDGEQRKNCYVDNGKLYGVFENYPFQKGRLYRREYYTVPDKHFSNGVWLFGDTFLTNIELI